MQLGLLRRQTESIKNVQIDCFASSHHFITWRNDVLPPSNGFSCGPVLTDTDDNSVIYQALTYLQLLCCDFLPRISLSLSVLDDSIRRGHLICLGQSLD